MAHEAKARAHFIVEIAVPSHWTVEVVRHWLGNYHGIVSVQPGTIQDIVDEAQDNARRAVGIDDGGLV